MADKLVERAQRRWRKLDGHHLIPEGLAGRRVPDGIIDETQISAADLPQTPPHPTPKIWSYLPQRLTTDAPQRWAHVYTSTLIEPLLTGSGKCEP